jgi:hypothetical protein
LLQLVIFHCSKKLFGVFQPLIIDKIGQKMKEFKLS